MTTKQELEKKVSELAQLYLQARDELNNYQTRDRFGKDSDFPAGTVLRFRKSFNNKRNDMYYSYVVAKIAEDLWNTSAPKGIHGLRAFTWNELVSFWAEEGTDCTDFKIATGWTPVFE